MFKTVFLTIISWLLAILPGLGFLLSFYYLYRLLKLKTEDKIFNWVNSLGSVCLLVFITLSVLVIKQVIKTKILSVIGIVGILVASAVIISVLALIMFFPGLELASVIRNLLGISVRGRFDMLFGFTIWAGIGTLPTALLGIIPVRFLAKTFSVNELVMSTGILAVLLGLVVFVLAEKQLGAVAGLIALATLVEIVVAALIIVLAMVIGKTTGDITIVFATATATIVPSISAITVLIALGGGGGRAIIEGAATLVVTSLAVLPAVLGGASIGWKMING